MANPRGVQSLSGGCSSCFGTGIQPAAALSQLNNSCTCLKCCRPVRRWPLVETIFPRKAVGYRLRSSGVLENTKPSMTYSDAQTKVLLSRISPPPAGADLQACPLDPTPNSGVLLRRHDRGRVLIPNQLIERCKIGSQQLIQCLQLRVDGGSEVFVDHVRLAGGLIVRTLHHH